MKPYYQDQAVTIYHGDCLEIMPQLEPVDHILSDPPFGAHIYVNMRTNKGNPSYTDNRTGAGITEQRRANEHAWASELQGGAIGFIDEILEAVAAEYARLGRRWILVYSDVETAPRWRAALEVNGTEYIRTGAWVKTNPMPQVSGDRPAQGFEVCTIAHPGGKKRWNGGGHPAVWIYASATSTSRPDHPCPKPLPLIKKQVEQFTDAGETILDGFAGSGTLGLAAKELGRKAILIEIEEKHCATAAKRMAQEVIEYK